MKKALSLCGIFALYGMVNALTPEEFPAGGVSVDFSKIYQSGNAAGKNLLFDGGFEEKILGKTSLNQWHGQYNIHVAKHELPNEKALMMNLAQLLSQKIVSSGNGKCLEILSPAEIMKFRAKGLPELSNEVEQYIDLPELKTPTKFQLSLKYRGRLENVAGLNTFHVMVFFKNDAESGKSKDTHNPIGNSFKLSEKWTSLSIDFVVPADTKKLGIGFVLYGCGKVDIDDVRMVKIPADKGVVAKLIPGSFLDKIFAVSENDPAIMAFTFKNEQRTKITKPILNIKLPSGFKLLDQSNTLTMDVEKNDDNAVYRINLSKLSKNFGKESFNTHYLAAVLIKSTLKSSDKAYTAEYWYQDGDYCITPEKIQLKVIPEIKGRRPAIFQTGVQIRREGDFAGAGVKEFTDFYSKTGCNVVHCALPPPQMSAAYKKLDILRYYEPFLLCNGYRLGPEPKPDAARFQLADGSYYADPHQAICPTEVYTQGSYYRKEVVGMLKSLLVDKDVADSIMCNWEPYMFDFKGCFCPRCKGEFIKYSGLNQADVDRGWPSEVIIKYRDQWIKFRSWQHAQMVTQLEKTINELGRSVGKNAHFTPEVATSQMLETRSPKSDQYAVKDYMDQLPMLEPWGPYIYYKFSEPYIYNLKSL